VVGFGAAYGAGRACGSGVFGVILQISLNLWVCRCGLDWFSGIPHSFLLALMDTRGLCFRRSCSACMWSNLGSGKRERGNSANVY
jgi:hypothetical protein